jgi:hypothetical protein
MTRTRFISIAATIAAAGGAAWLVKFPVVAAMDGDESTAASVLYLGGVLCLFAGSTWLGVALAGERSRLLLAALVALSPVAFWCSYMALDAAGVALAGGGAEEWLKDELGVALTGALWLCASAWSLRDERAALPGRA